MEAKINMRKRDGFNRDRFIILVMKRVVFLILFMVFVTPPIIGLDKTVDPIISFKRQKNKLLMARTTEKYWEIGVPVCYLNERGDTIIPFGKYRFCQTDTIKNIGFAYENKVDGNIVCLDKQGKKLFNVFRYDNGPDYVQEGLFRIVDDRGRIGYADSLGTVVIEPRFLFGFPFEKGRAKVTDKGEEKEVPGSGGEKRYWDSDDWYYIDKQGKVIK